MRNYVSLNVVYVKSYLTLRTMRRRGHEAKMHDDIMRPRTRTRPTTARPKTRPLASRT